MADRQVLHSFAARVMDYFKKEKLKKGPMIDVCKVAESTTAAFQIDVRTVCRIENELEAQLTHAKSTFSTPGKNRRKISIWESNDDLDEEALRRHSSG